MKKALIFSGYNFRAVIALCRLLDRAGVIPLIIARDEDDPIFKTNYAKWVGYIRRDSSLDISLFECLGSHIHDWDSNTFILMPTSEYLNRFALNNKTVLLDLGISIPLVEMSLYSMLSDKAAFRSLCNTHKIPVPKSVEFDINSIPFVAKQKCFDKGGVKQAKPYIIQNEDAFLLFQQSEDPNLYFYEEYVEGESVYLMLFIEESETISFSQQNILQQDQGGSMIAAVESDFHHSAISLNMINVLKDIGFIGVVMVEFRLNESGNYMIEANPRYWGPLQFCVDNSPALVWKFMQSYGVIPDTSDIPPPRVSGFYFWSGGWQKDLVLSRQLKYHPGSENIESKIIPEMLKDDVFCREDTMPLFLAELNKDCFT